ncbi:MAG: energy-coupled thiamine transporter ThiT [Ruminococcaceae bacterium]|nr:energy-coupled thiamine transporter ThiT [Oscillospiraceae bacterium]
MENKAHKNHLRIRALCEGALMVALAQILSFIKLFPNLPNGGSITFAMFPICFYAVRWGLGKGLMAGFVFGLLQLIFDGAYAWGWQSMILDYLLAFTPLGLAGLFRGKIWGIFPGTVVGCAGRFLVHFISGITVYRIYVPTEVPGVGTFDDATLYSLVYNGVYMLPCALLALAVAGVLFVPMKKLFAGKDIA